MYLETILEELKVEIVKLKKEVISLKQEGLNNSPSEYTFINDLDKLKFWPYSPAATRKMISRGKLLKGIHYTKLDGKIICNTKALKDYLSQNFITLRRTA